MASRDVFIESVIALELSTTKESEHTASDIDRITEDIAFLLSVNDETMLNYSDEIEFMKDASRNVSSEDTVMVANEVERWTLLFVVMGYSLFTLVVNGFTIAVVRAEHRLHKPEYTVMVMFAVVNIGFNIPFNFLQILPRLIFIDVMTFEAYPLVACRLFSGIAIIFAYMSLYSPAILSVMRYIQICHPLVYIAHVTDYTVYALFGIALAISGIYTVATEIVIGREPAVHSLVCQLSYARVNILMQMTLFVLIPLLILVFCTVRIYWIGKKMRDARRHKSQQLNLKIGKSVDSEERNKATDSVDSTENPCKPPIKEIRFLSADTKQSTSKLQPISESTDSDSSHHSAQQQETMASHMTSVSTKKTTKLGKRRRIMPLQSPQRNRRQRRNSSMTTSSHERALKTVKLIVLLSGTYFATQLPPLIGRAIIALRFAPKSDENFGEISEGHMIGDITVTTFVMRWMSMIYVGFYPCINPLILMRMDKEYKLFRKYAAFCSRNHVGIQS